MSEMWSFSLFTVSESCSFPLMCSRKATKTILNNIVRLSYLFVVLLSRLVIISLLSPTDERRRSKVSLTVPVLDNQHLSAATFFHLIILHIFVLLCMWKYVNYIKQDYKSFSHRLKYNFYNSLAFPRVSFFYCNSLCLRWVSQWNKNYWTLENCAICNWTWQKLMLSRSFVSFHSVTKVSSILSCRFW